MSPVSVRSGGIGVGGPGSSTGIHIGASEATTCGISGTPLFSSVWKLPQLPLTEMFGPFDPGFPAFDQELMMSGVGHVQLRYRLDPDWLYAASNYAYRSIVGAKAEREMDLLRDFIRECLKGQLVNHILEVGGNDLTLARRYLSFTHRYTVCDPVLAEQDGTSVDGIEIIGRTIETAIESLDFEPPDLVIARHTIEHIADPRATLTALVRASTPGCLFIVELPSLEHLAEALRFDAVFHQHYHYFDISSARRLIFECGGEYVDHVYNSQGSNGGSLLFAFRNREPRESVPALDLEQRFQWLKRRIAIFSGQLELVGELLESMPDPLYGYGAGHMLATLGYHLRTDFLKLTCVLDDDPAKHGMAYRNVDIQVRDSALEMVPAQSAFLITSMENLRPIHRRIQELEPRRILNPIVT